MLFVAAPLISATSSQSGPYPGYFCSELPPSYFFCSFCNLNLLFAAVIMHLAPQAAAPAYREPGSITHAFLSVTVPLRFVTAGCKPAQKRSITSNRPTLARRHNWGLDTRRRFKPRSVWRSLCYILQKCPGTLSCLNILGIAVSHDRRDALQEYELLCSFARPFSQSKTKNS